MTGTTARIAATVACIVAWTHAAQADTRPTTSTDGFYVGARLEPGAALLAGWDLDVYIFRNRSISIGPGVSVAVLSTHTNAPGQQQDFLLAADVLRLKVAPVATGDLRPFISLGGGFSYVRLAEQTVTLPAGQPSGTTVTFAATDGFAPMVSLGGGADYFLGGPIAVTLLMLAHYQFGDSGRVPDLWLDVSVGIRFGL